MHHRLLNNKPDTKGSGARIAVSRTGLYVAMCMEIYAPFSNTNAERIIKTTRKRLILYIWPPLARWLQNGIVKIETSLLKMLPDNDKIPALSGEQYDRLRKSIEKHGIRTPLHITADNIILCGHHRFLVAKQLNLDTVPAIIKSVPAKDRLEYAIRDNVERRQLSNDEIDLLIEYYVDKHKKAGIEKNGCSRRLLKSGREDAGKAEQ